MAKSIKLQSRTEIFKTMLDAKNYYINISKELALNKQQLTNGQLFMELKEIYEKYCEYTCYQDMGAIKAFKAGNTVRENIGTHSTTICFSAIFDNGESKEFSIIKALRAIAEHQHIHQ